MNEVLKEELADTFKELETLKASDNSILAETVVPEVNMAETVVDEGKLADTVVAIEGKLADTVFAETMADTVVAVEGKLADTAIAPSINSAETLKPKTDDSSINSAETQKASANSCIKCCAEISLNAKFCIICGASQV